MFQLAKTFLINFIVIVIIYILR